MIATAILLAAGEGSRLRPVAPVKPLCPVAGRPLIDHAIERLAAAGLSRVVVVTGFQAGAVAEHLARHHWPIPVATVATEDYRAPNGVSLLAAAPWIGDDDALLAMADHLVEPSLYARVAATGAGAGLTLGIDRRLGAPWVDQADVTCVETAGDRITAIGKGLARHDAYDTGVFAIGPSLFAALGAIERPSLTDGVRRLASEGRARVVDVSDCGWIDVDDAAALAAAEAWLAPGTTRALGRAA